MKHKTHHLYYLFYPRNWIIIALLLFSVIATAQEQPPPEEFLFGASWGRNYRYNAAFYDIFRATGMNFLFQYADTAAFPKSLLEGLNFAAYNGEHPNEWVQYYSTAYYSKWEAEEDQTYRYRVGFKHRERLEGQEILGDLIGSPATFSGRECWSTVGLTSPRDSLIYGPHYHQEKVYKRWYADYLRYDLFYTPRFIMALKVEEGAQLNDTDPICRLKVVARYRTFENGEFGEDQDTLLKSVILYASDFQPYDTFKVFYFGSTPEERWYEYPPEFRDPVDGSNKREFGQTPGVQFFDRWGDQGVQFRVDWLGDNSKYHLYIDYIEVYDNDGWNKYVDNPQEVVDSIVAYAQRYPQSQWQNMKYWGGCDEPSSLDDYFPLKKVDSILDSIGAPRLITTFYPWWEVKVNEDTQLVRYYNTVQPEKLIIDFFPFLADYPVTRFDDWETTGKCCKYAAVYNLDFIIKRKHPESIITGGVQSVDLMLMNLKHKICWLSLTG